MNNQNKGEDFKEENDKYKYKHFKRTDDGIFIDENDEERPLDPDKSYFWLSADENSTPEFPEGFETIRLNLDNISQWEASLTKIAKEKVNLLYVQDLKLLPSIIKTTSMDSLPLGEFVLAKSGYKLKTADEFRSALFKVIFALRKKTELLFKYEDFSEIFDESLKDDINFELKFYFNIFNAQSQNQD